MPRTLLIYVAGPLTTSGTTWGNVRAACRAGDAIRRCGHQPLIPHCHGVLNAMVSEPACDLSYEDWMLEALLLVSRSDALFRVRGISSGASREEAYARRLGIPVYMDHREIPRLIRSTPEGDEYYPPLPPPRFPEMLPEVADS